MDTYNGNLANMDEKILDKKIEDLGLSESTTTLLKRLGCETIFNVLLIGESGIMKDSAFDAKTGDEIKNKLASYGLEYQKEPIDVDMIVSGLGREGMDYLKRLPNKYFADKSTEFLILRKVVSIYLNNFAEISCVCAVTKADYDKIRREVTDKIVDFKKLIVQKKADLRAENQRNKFMDEMTDMINDKLPKSNRKIPTKDRTL